MIEADRISVRADATPLLANVSFNAKPDEFVGLLGPNGAGKSTCLKALTGLIPIDAGAIRVNGRDLKDMPVTERATVIGYLPQDRAVYWPVPARRIVELGLYANRKAGGGADAATRLVDETITEVGAIDFATRPVDQLSGGEKARIHLARVLVGGPKVVLCDEPTAALDPRYQLSVMKVLQRRAKAGAVVIAALHDLALAARFCTRIILLNEGTVVADGEPAKTLTTENIGRVFGVHADDIAAPQFKT